MDKKESRGSISIIPERSPAYGCHPANGFGVATGNDGQIMLQPFFDEPPLPENFEDADSAQTIRRQIWSAYVFSPVQARILWDMLGDALRNLKENHEKDD